MWLVFGNQLKGKMKTGVYNQATIAEVQERYHGILDYGDSDGEG